MHKRRARSVERLLNPNQLHFHEGFVEVDGTAVFVVLRWKNPELYGLWETRYELNFDCFFRMQWTGQLQRSAASQPNRTERYVLRSAGTP